MLWCAQIISYKLGKDGHALNFWMTELAPPRREVSQTGTGCIPKILYQTWCEPRVHSYFYYHIAKFWSHNDDLQVVLFDDAKCDAFMEEEWGIHPVIELYRLAKIGPLKSDIFRYCLVYSRGGYYCDISKGVLTRWSELVPEQSSGVISFEKNRFFIPVSDDASRVVRWPQNYVCNWAFGFAPEHPLLKIVIDRLVEYSDRYRGRLIDRVKETIVTYTGPGLFTQCFHDFQMSHSDSDICQLDVDFCGYGKMNLRGSRLRFLRRRSYKYLANETILG